MFDTQFGWALQRNDGSLEGTNKELVWSEEIGIISWMYVRRNIQSPPATSDPGKGEFQALPPTQYRLQGFGAIVGMIGSLFDLTVDRLAKLSGSDRADISARPKRTKHTQLSHTQVNESSNPVSTR